MAQAEVDVRSTRDLSPWARWFVPRRRLRLSPPAGAPPPNRPAVSNGLAAAAVGWGLWIGTVAGATAGTLLVPTTSAFGVAFPGAIFGAPIGLVVAVAPTLVGTAAVVATARRQPAPLDPDAFVTDLANGFARLVGVPLLAIGALYLALAASTADQIANDLTGGSPRTGQAVHLGWTALVIAATTVVTVALLRRATLALTRRLARAHGWTGIST